MNHLATAIASHQTADQAILMVFLTLTTFALAGMGTLVFVRVSKLINEGVGFA